MRRMPSSKHCWSRPDRPSLRTWITPRRFRRTSRRAVERTMRTSGVLMLVGALLSLGGSVGAATEPAAPATQHSVVIENMQFNPPQLTVHRGDRIVWVNKDLFPHTVTSVNKKFDSGSIAAGSSWSWVARSSGEFAYGCTFHPTMKATVKVQ